MAFLGKPHKKLFYPSSCTAAKGTSDYRSFAPCHFCAGRLGNASNVILILPQNVEHRRNSYEPGRRAGIRRRAIARRAVFRIPAVMAHA